MKKDCLSLCSFVFRQWAHCTLVKWTLLFLTCIFFLAPSLHINEANPYLSCKVLIGCLMPVSEVVCSWISLHLLTHNEPKLWLVGFVSILQSGKESKPISVRLSRRYHTWMQWILRACSALTLMTPRLCWTFEFIRVTMTTRFLFFFSLEAQIFVLGIPFHIDLPIHALNYTSSSNN